MGVFVGVGISRRTTSVDILMVLLLFLLLLLLPSAPVFSANNLFSLVYKGCANQTFGESGDGISQQSMAALSSSLISQSAKTNFFKTSSSSSSSLFGLFQCRGDITQSDCSACVSHLPAMWVSLCGQSVAVRVQLNGCYGLYEVAGFPKVSGTKMLYKYCSSRSGGGTGFEEKRGTALAALQTGVVGVSGGSGFYATSYGSVYAMAQCEGDLSVADCGECVAEAIQKAQVECGGASAGQMYLSRCYITYSYYSHGVPKGGGSDDIGAASSNVISSSSGGSGDDRLFCLFNNVVDSIMKS